MKAIKQKEIDQEITFSQEKFFNIVIESPAFYREFLSKTKNQLENGDDYLLYYEDDAPTDLGKCCYLMDNPLSIQIDEKKSNLLIQKDISSRITEEQREKYELLLKEISDYLDEITYDYVLPVSFDSDFSLISLLKSISLCAAEDQDGFLGYLLFQIKRISYVNRINLFIFVNLHDYLTEKEMRSFIQSMRSLELNFFFLSSHMPVRPDSEESIIRIDEDLCEFHIDSQNIKN